MIIDQKLKSNLELSPNPSCGLRLVPRLSPNADLRMRPLPTFRLNPNIGQNLNSNLDFTMRYSSGHTGKWQPQSEPSHWPEMHSDPCHSLNHDCNSGA